MMFMDIRLPSKYIKNIFWVPHGKQVGQVQDREAKHA
jgi:hypothetical protein